MQLRLRHYQGHKIMSEPGPRAQPTKWTAERDAELTRHWEAGQSAKQSATELGVTRNAVIGRRYRLGLPAHPSFINAPWTEERNTQLRQYCADGVSAREIATRLGVARNTALAQIYKLGLRVRSVNPARPKTPPAPKAPRASTSPRPAQPPRPIPAPNPRTFKQLLDFHCRWPYGEFAPFTFCGAIRREDCRYCEEHARIAYRPRAA